MSNTVFLENLKLYQRYFHKKICDYYKFKKSTSTKDFLNLWNNFMSISELIYIFEDYPFVYSIFVDYNKKKDLASYYEYEKIYDYCIDLLYSKIGVYFG
jgi:hypothetical protein